MVEISAATLPALEMASTRLRDWASIWSVI